LAEAVTAYRAGMEQRARQAELDRAAAQTRAAEERKRRRLIVVLAVVVLLAVVGGGWFWLRQERKRSDAEHEADAALGRAELLQKEGKWGEALAQTQQAQGLLSASGDPPALRQRIDDHIAEIELGRQLDDIRNTAKTRDAPGRMNTRSYADALYGKTFREFGIDVDALDPAEAARQIAARPRLKPFLVAALDDWVVPRKDARPSEPAYYRHLLAVARSADADPWRDRLREAVGRDDVAALKEMAAAPDLTAPVSTLQLLADWLFHSHEDEAGLALLRRLQWQHPGDPEIAIALAYRLGGEEGGPSDQEEYRRCTATALALNPDIGDAWNNYSIALLLANRLEDATAAAERAVRLAPDRINVHRNLAVCLRLKGDRAGMRQHLEIALENSRRLVERDPQDLNVLAAQAWILQELGRNAEALEAWLKRAEYLPDPAEKSMAVGDALAGAGRIAEAIPHFEKALQLDPNLGLAADRLAGNLTDLGQLDEAVKWARQGIKLPNWDLPDTYNNLAYTLVEKGASLEEAEEAIDRALKLQPNRSIAVLTLAEVRRAQGRFDESLAAYRRGHEIHRTENRLRWPTEQWIKDAERRVELDKQLPAIRKGERKPASAAEYAELGQLCVYKRLYAASAGFYQQAFALDPKLADDLGAGHRYQAARAAAMAGCGHDAENDRLDAAARAGLRRLARDWLNADLDLRRKQLHGGKPEDRPPVLYALNHWRSHDHLAGIRDPALLTRLSAEEQAECRKLWSEANTLWQQASNPSP
jgi:tetratricopeptide (TPR) repeat protein